MKNQTKLMRVLVGCLLALFLFTGQGTALAEENSFIGKTVTKVAVTGNRLITDPDILAAVKLKAGQPLTAEAVRTDLQGIYELGWFYDVGTDFADVPEGVQVTYRVRENPVFKKLEVQGNTKVSTADIQTLLELKKEAMINGKTLNERVRKLEERYHKDGYILARVSDINLRPDGTLSLVINEGIVEGFSVKGNEKTKDYVILREMRLKKGEPFNVKEARRSLQRLYNLGFFEDVNVKLNPGKAPNGVEVEITVVEQKTGTFGIGAGYSKDDGMVGILSLGDKNFRGTGDKVNVRWEFGGADARNYEFGYVHPWLDSKETYLGLNVYRMTNEYTEYNDDTSVKDVYDKRREGWDLTLGRAQGEYITNSITLKNREDTYVEGVEDETTNFYDNNPDEKSKNFGLTRSVLLQRVIDTRDSVHNPTEGKRYLLSSEFAGHGLGGDFSFNKYNAEARQYFKVGHAQTIAVRLNGGYANGTMPLSQRFALGGSDNLRGYKDDQFRGYKMLSATAEYRFPLAKKFDGVLFSDTGYAWDKGESVDFADFKTSVGVGVRVGTPLGAVRLDYAKGEQESRFHFSFGGQF